MPEAPTPNETFARYLREVRERRRWSQQDLADRMDELGWPLDRSTIARTEAGPAQRKVSLDEAIALSAALGVAPIHMFVPRSDDEKLALTPTWTVGAHSARQWVRGRLALASNTVEEDARVYYIEVADEVMVRALEALRLATQDEEEA